jgi:hypothetical protein
MDTLDGLASSSRMSLGKQGCRVRCFPNVSGTRRSWQVRLKQRTLQRKWVGFDKKNTVLVDTENALLPLSVWPAQTIRGGYQSQLDNKSFQL